MDMDIVVDKKSLDLADILSKKLDDHKQKNLFRVREVTLPDNYIDFSSNDYLGLSKHPEIIKVIRSFSGIYGAQASSYVSGYFSEHKSCEDAFAKAFGFDGALLFGNGFMANVGVIKALADKNTVIFQDKKNHASLIDGALISDGELVRYNHLDSKSLENKIKKYPNKSGIIASDVVFSMDGDIAEVKDLVAIGSKHNYAMIFDEAHSAGVMGKNGLGVVSNLIPDLISGLAGNIRENIRENIIVICPLGKAFGGYGSIVLANGVYLEAITQFARTLIYSTALPPLCAKLAEKSLEIILNNLDLQKKLQQNIEYFISKSKKYKLPVLENSVSAVQGILLGNPNAALSLSKYLKNLGYNIIAIRSPTVSPGGDRIRITIRAEHSFEQIDGLVCAIRDYFKICKNQYKY